MIHELPDDRQVLPRWHSPEVNASRAEARSLPDSDARRVPDINLDDLADDFARHRDVVHAGDLVSAAVAAGRSDVVEEAARFILDSAESSTLARHVAATVLHASAEAIPEIHLDAIDRAATALEIARVRQRLRRNPVNALAWAELARQYTIVGEKDKATRAMRTALGLAPHDRYILRSASRLWVHVGKPDEAHRILTRSPRTTLDPWLISAELATADIAGRPSRLVRAGRDLLDRLPPFHTTELAAALATAELEAGRDRHARRLFESALLEPNDNSLAQAEWASNHIHLPDFDPQLELVPSSYEARALDAAGAGRSDDAVVQADLWLADEAFSSRAASFGSYEASKAMDFKTGADFARKGLIANPHDSTLLNNLAFCLAKLGDVDEADDALSRITHVDDGDTATITATRGLIAFRRGDVKRGTELYLDAIRVARERRRKAIALIMLASELMRIDPRDEGPAFAREASSQVEDLPDQEARAWLRHLPAPDDAPSTPKT